MSTLLPELPEPFTYPTGDIPHACVCGSWPGGECLRCTAINFYTADQVRAIQLEAWKAAIEAAAIEAEGFRSNDRAVNLTAREIITGEVAEDIAAAIRSLPSPE